MPGAKSVSRLTSRSQPPQPQDAKRSYYSGCS